MKKMTDNVPTLNWMVSNKDSILPGYVGAVPSMKIAAMACLCVLLIGTLIAMIDMYRNRKDTRNTMKLRWILVQLITLYITIKLFPMVQRKIYVIHNLQRNSQHFANVFWLKEYMEAFRLVDSSIGI